MYAHTYHSLLFPLSFCKNSLSFVFMNGSSRPVRRSAGVFSWMYSLRFTRPRHAHSNSSSVGSASPKRTFIPSASSVITSICVQG